MPKPWYQLIDIIVPSIVKIETPDGQGTGFFIGYNEPRTWALIATARHVVEEADRWLQPIRIHNIPQKKVVLLQEPDRVIIHDPARDGDTTIIFALADKVSALQFPQQPVEFISAGNVLRVGVEVAWLGYPGITRNTLCFFSGNISARHSEMPAYYIDGVSIAGVSGGPVFYVDNDRPKLIGSISGYARREATMPGLCVAHDVSHLQRTVEVLNNRQEAVEKKKEQEQQPLLSAPPALPASKS